MKSQIEAKYIMQDSNRTRLYCHKCGKIISNLVFIDKIKDWIKCPYCIDCLMNKWSKI